MADQTLWIGMAAAACGVGFLRWSWSLKYRSTIANLAAWALLLIACVVGGIAAGAWGIAVVALVAMGLAAVLLAWAAAMSPAGRSNSSDRRVRMLPDGNDPLCVGRRVVTFTLVVIAGFIASVCLAITLRSGAIGLGWTEADANATALFVVPIVWGMLATIMLMARTRREQIVALLVASLPLVPALLVGG